MWTKSYESLYNPPTEKVEPLFENEMITNENDIDEISVAKLVSACMIHDDTWPEWRQNINKQQFSVIHIGDDIIHMNSSSAGKF